MAITPKQIALFTFSLFTGSVLAQAQQTNGVPVQTILNKSDLMLQSTLVNASSSVYTTQVGQITTYQQGDGNRQYVNPTAGENNLRLVQQGDFNNMNLNLLGEGNTYQFSQLGNNNDLQLRSLEASNNTLQIIQRGNGNQLIDNGSGLLDRPIRIEQTGGMKVFINGQ